MFVKKRKSQKTGLEVYCLCRQSYRLTVCHGTPLDYVLGVCLWFCVDRVRVHSSGVLHVETPSLSNVRACPAPVSLAKKKTGDSMNSYL